MGKREEFLIRLQATFKVEAEEHLQALSCGLVEVAQEPCEEERTGILETIFREAHSLKGAARAVDMADIEATSHALENVLAALKRGDITRSGNLLDTLGQVVDDLGKLISSPQEVSVPELIQRLTRLEAGESDSRQETDIRPMREETGAASPEEGRPEAKDIQPAPDRPSEADPALAASNVPEPVGSADWAVREESTRSETIRISTARLDALLLQAEEMLAAKLAATQRVADLLEVGGSLDSWKKKGNRIAPQIRELRQLLAAKEGKDRQGRIFPSLAGLMEFVDWNERHVNTLEGRLTALAEAAERDRHAIGGMVDQLLEDMKKGKKKTRPLSPKMRETLRDMEAEESLAGRILKWFSFPF